MSKRTKLLLKENNQLESQINNDDRQVLTDIVVYIRSANISPYYQELVRRDIWQMIIDGESRGMTAKEVIGEDYKCFCDNIIAEIPKLSRKERAMSLVRDICPSAAILITIWAASNVIKQFLIGNSWPYFVVTAGNIFSAVLIIFSAFFLFSSISEHSFDNDAFTNKSMFCKLLAILLLCMCANSLLRFPLFRVHAFIVAAAIIILFALCKILDKRID